MKLPLTSGAVIGPKPDVVLAKCAAGRKRDWEFAAAAIDAGLVSAVTLLERVPDLALDDEPVARLKAWLSARGAG